MTLVWLSPLWMPVAFAWRAPVGKKKKLLYFVFSALASYAIAYLLNTASQLTISQLGGYIELESQLRQWSHKEFWLAAVAEWLLQYWYLTMLSLCQLLGALMGSYLLHKYWLKRPPSAR